MHSVSDNSIRSIVHDQQQMHSKRIGLGIDTHELQYANSMHTMCMHLHIHKSTLFTHIHLWAILIAISCQIATPFLAMSLKRRFLFPAILESKQSRQNDITGDLFLKLARGFPLALCSGTLSINSGFRLPPLASRVGSG